MNAAKGAVIEIAAGDERGWGYLFDGGFIGSRRVALAGGGGPARARRFGDSEWGELDGITANQPSPGLTSALGMLTRRGRKAWRTSVQRDAGSHLRLGSRLPESSMFTLWAQVLAGELTIRAAEDAAMGLSAGGDVIDQGIDEAAVMGKQLSLVDHADVGVVLSRLAYAAACAPAAGISGRTRASAACDLLEAARLSLTHVPDPRLLAGARTAGDAALAWARDHQDSLISQMASFRLGTIHLDPYQHDLETYWQEHKAWLRRGMAALGMPPSSGSEEELRAFMPMPVPALRTAETYLREGVDARTGEARGFALKALANALMFLKGLGEEVSAGDLALVALEASRLLPPGEEEAQRFLRQFIPDAGVFQLPALADPVGPAGGQSHRPTALKSGAIAAAGTDPDTATRLVEERRDLMAGKLGESPVDQLLLELRVAVKNTVSGSKRELEQWPADEILQQALRNRLRSGADSAAVRCALLLDLARDAARTGWGPTEALLCVDDALAADPGQLGLRDAVIDFVRARLWFDRAGELREVANRSGDAAELAMAYAHAVDLFHRAGVPELSVEALERVTEHFPSIPPKAGLDVLNYVSGTTLGLGDRADPETDRIVQWFLAVALGRFLSGGLAWPELVVWIANLAKGARLASTLALGRTAGLEVPAELAADLARADADESALIESRLDQASEDDPDNAADWLLVGYADTVEEAPSDTPVHKLRGRQRILDQALNRLLALPGKSLHLNLEGMQKRLGERSMLLIQLPAMWRTDTWGTSWLLVTPTAAHTQFLDSHAPYADLHLEVSGRTIGCSPDVAWVESLRREIQEDPGPDVAPDDVLEELDGRRLGDLWDRLDEALTAGHDHLIVAPHGPGHYVPWHLLGPADQPLAARCAVTTLPNLGLLAPSTFTDLAMRLQHSADAASFGLSYRSVSSQGLGQLPHAEQEAAEIAEVLGVDPVLEERATVGAVIDALEAARYVHISAHGRHNADAAAFQSIQLAGSPARLAAHRLCVCDLRGLHLVTLSACETALGRFDRADNLRGIPAALMLAGVRSIVGTLWEARSSAARLFFTSMYRELLANADDVVTAFRAAQRQTRDAFPAYRDWGVFVLMGGLKETYESRERS